MNSITLDQAYQLADKYMTDATIGLEIEVLDPLQNEEKVIRMAGTEGIKIVSRGYTHDVIIEWKFVDDGSVNGRELVSPPLKPQRLFRELKSILDILVICGYKGERYYSVHVHHDASKYNNKRLRYFLNHVVKNEVNFDCLVSQS